MCILFKLHYAKFGVSNLFFSQKLSKKNLWGGERCKFWKVLKKCQNLLFFDIFWDILNKMKDNLCQKCVKGGHLSLQGKFEKLPLAFLEN